MQATSRRRTGAQDSISRQRVIDAAIACIIDQGFYRASTNAIAERAGVTWGVIQYHFGTREALMLAVLEEGTRRLNDIVVTAEIAGETVTERVAQYMDILVKYYGSTDYLAFSQVLINLTHDPRTSQQTRETMTRHLMLETLPEQPHTPRHVPEQRRLLAEALGMLIEAQSQP